MGLRDTIDGTYGTCTTWRTRTTTSRPTTTSGPRRPLDGPDLERLRGGLPGRGEDLARGARAVPGLPSGDTAEGFALHLEWEQTLHADRWAVVSWPEAYGGRDASLWEWLIFEEEYYRAGAPQRVTQNGIFLLAPTIFEFGTRSSRTTTCPAWRRRGPVVPGLVRAQRRLRPGGPHQGHPRRRRRRVGLTGRRPGRPAGAFCTGPVRAVPHRPRGERHKGLTYFMVPLDARA
jgi:alkylation response protein AidB-like acyl-CoA dehydrogenase